MHPLDRTGIVVAKAVVGLLLLGGMGTVAAAAVYFGGGFGLLGVVLYATANVWAVYTFLRYRHGLQDELLVVLAATAEARQPLPSGVEAYLDGRPPPSEFGIAVRWLAFVAFPLYAYARLWLGWRRYDQLVEELAERLEGGESLSDALRSVPGVAPREVRLAAAVGEATGALGASLRGADRQRWSAAWLDVAPRLVYPLLVLIFVSGVAAFLMTFILPRFVKIFHEFGAPLPPETRLLRESWSALDAYVPQSGLAVVLILAVAAVPLVSTTARWYTPVLGRVYRWVVQAEVLRTLGRLLAVGRTVPQALDFLAASGDLPGVARRRVGAAAAGVGRGDPLAQSLRAAGLLPASMAPLVQASERTGTLPAALLELGEHLAGRAFRVVRRASMLVSPLLVMAVGTVVGFIAIGMFTPLIHLLTSLSE